MVREHKTWKLGGSLALWARLQRTTPIAAHFIRHGPRQPRQPKFRPRRSEMSQSPKYLRVCQKALLRPVLCGCSHHSARLHALKLCAMSRPELWKAILPQTPSLNTVALKSRRFLGSLALTVGPLSFMVSCRAKPRLQIKSRCFLGRGAKRAATFQPAGNTTIAGHSARQLFEMHGALFSRKEVFYSKLRRARLLRFGFALPWKHACRSWRAGSCTCFTLPRKSTTFPTEGLRPSQRSFRIAGVTWIRSPSTTSWWMPFMFVSSSGCFSVEASQSGSSSVSVLAQEGR